MRAAPKHGRVSSSRDVQAWARMENAQREDGAFVAQVTVNNVALDAQHAQRPTRRRSAAPYERPSTQSGGCLPQPPCPGSSSWHG